MINLNNNNIVNYQEANVTPQKARPKMKKNSQDKINNSNSRAAGTMLLPGNTDKITYADDIQ